MRGGGGGGLGGGRSKKNLFPRDKIKLKKIRACQLTQKNINAMA